MALSIVQMMDIDPESQKSLESLQEAIKQAVVKKIENDNVQYLNQILDTAVAPLLKSLKLDVSRNRLRKGLANSSRST
ncbi:hypothetical protein P170DRAFT_437573 [Aspergillus steynii IBT 23096]|uniref:Uncharacterized protein n=1 Tax=Aspergillus steynii IBT 23096 TaxID=1392250 RepID=A0A2I2G4P2_9EURO|nr:uncharacterized protein P170DRAFT_437573 [Aspergillus steynii IBT 23096]PLB47839.1 hypothetical protein P170DRAFT_437573 [Aspergillus steynii IBT 23096]